MYYICLTKNNIMKKITTLLSMLFCYSINAQISTNCSEPFDSADELVELIVGSGVTFSNATLYAQDCTAGYFSGNTNLGMEDGLILATGGIESAEINPSGNLWGGAGVDADLSSLLNDIGASIDNINNLVLLEFDIVPVSNTVSFEYVFASNEYPNYTCSQYNDVFGFFISGPGINGTYSNNAENIALIPDPNNWGEYTSTPVAINTINSGVASSGDSSPCNNIDSNWQDYSIYYVDNQPMETVNFPGFTVPLTAMSEVVANETYHIKLAVADVVDMGFNSAVFIQEGSLSSFLTICENQSACNFNEYGACIYSDEYYNCEGNCINDTDQDGYCDELEVHGCTDPSFTNYNPLATEDNGSCGNGSMPCILPEFYQWNTGLNMTALFNTTALENLPELSDNAYIVVSALGSGLVVGSTMITNENNLMVAIWGDDSLTEEIDGAMNNEQLLFQIVDGTNLYNIIPTSTNDNIVYMTNGIEVISSLEYYLGCSQLGCIDSEAFNYDEQAIINDGTCIYDINVEFTQPTNESDFNSTYSVNIDSLINGGLQIDDGDLIGAFYLLDGELISAGYSSYEGISPVEIVIVGDDPETELVEGVLENQEIIWIIQDVETGENILIAKPVSNGHFDASSNVNIHLSELSQSHVLGCMELEACNYNILANINDNSCVYAIDGLDCEGNCINDFDMDGECDEWDYDDGLGVDELEADEVHLIKMVDVLGKEHYEHKQGMILFYIYDNGTIVKKVK
jgi:hypothetical protein